MTDEQKGAKIKTIPVHTPEFSEQDAAAIIALVRRAPLQNMAEAEGVNKLLDRFANWFQHVTSEGE